MLTLLERAEAEIEVKRSRFIAIAIPTDSMDKVKAAVDRVRAEHPTANHVVHASVIGSSGTMYSSSDDREPKNTAGRPALEVLKGSGITNILVCIVRYFGGTLLGTGGLVKAYGDAVKAVLPLLETEELIEKKRVNLILSYDLYTQLKRIFEKHGASIEEENFDINISVAVLIRSDRFDGFIKDVKDLGQGRIDISLLD